MDRKNFGKRIKTIRKELNMTSDALSTLVEVNPVFIRQIESGARLPSLPVFIKICCALNTSPEYLLFDELTTITTTTSKNQEVETMLTGLSPAQQEKTIKMLKTFTETLQ